MSALRSPLVFHDRRDAGRVLATHLTHLAGEDVVVLGLPRGGVPVAAEVALALHAPLDVLLVRKLGHPYQPELAIGAIGEGDVRYVDPRFADRIAVEAVEAVERRELDRRTRLYRGDRPPTNLVGRVALLVDDGIATGASARVACLVARAAGARRVVLATPVAPPSAVAALRDVADEIVCVEEPRAFMAVGEWYEDFGQTTDTEVIELLGRASCTATEIVLDLGDVQLPGRLAVPAGAAGLVVFAHGSGSSRHSVRNQAVAATLESAGLGTLLFDLLSPSEAARAGSVFDIPLLGDRLVRVLDALRRRPSLRDVPVGCFGASTGAAAALWAASEPGALVQAVVSRGGRPDLVGADRLERVTAPTLLVVGGADVQVLELNRAAASHLRCAQELVMIPGATHLFEEPGALERVSQLARAWFLRHLDR